MVLVYSTVEIVTKQWYLKSLSVVKFSISVSESLVCRVNQDLNKKKKKFSFDGHVASGLLAFSLL